jgi:hypothetical protein
MPARSYTTPWDTIRGRRCIQGLAFLATLLVVQSADHGQDLSTGNAFYTHCKDATSWGGAKCLAYLDGLQDMVAWLAPADKQGVICAPNGTTKGDFLDVVLKFIKNYPYQRQKPTRS